MDRELACRELVELVTDYLDGALPPSERERFDAHLRECDACRHYLEQIRTTIRLTRQTADLEQCPEFTALLAAFRGYRRAAL